MGHLSYKTIIVCLLCSLEQSIASVEKKDSVYLLKSSLGTTANRVKKQIWK